MADAAYRIYMRYGEYELGVDGVEPGEALRLFERLRGAEAPGPGGMPTKAMIDAGAEVFRRCRTDPTFARARTDADMAREIFAAMRGAAA